MRFPEPKRSMKMMWGCVALVVVAVIVEVVNTT
jgi:hypothetical protein